MNEEKELLLKSDEVSEYKKLSEEIGKKPTLKSMMGELTFMEWVKTVQEGLQKPKDTGEYRYASHQVKRLWSPVCGIFFPCVVMICLLIAPVAIIANRDATIVSIEATKPQDILKEDKIKPPDPVEPPLVEIITPDLGVGDSSEPAGTMGTGGPDSGESGTPFSPVPSAFDSVAMVKSPITMKGVYASRMPGARGTLWGQGGKGGRGGTGGSAIEGAILRALRYLKKNQAADGSWPKNQTAMTGMAILTFLAHGETPSESKEFGLTVQKAIEYLISQQGANGIFVGNYHHPIATYALCEAYGMTLNPNVRSAAEKAVTHIIQCQHASGGWNYYGAPDPARDDSSVMGWSAQALKAAKMAEVFNDTAALDRAIKLAVKGFQKNASPSGGFGYTEPGATGLSGAGALCMQLLGAPNSGEVLRTLAFMDAWSPNWEKPIVPGGSPQYYFYYATQAMFHSGGERWKRWNDLMWRSYVKAQQITPQAIADMNGKLQDIGWWENKDAHTDRPIMDTCLTALQLMVYYRYLPTFITAKAVVDDGGVAAVNVQDNKGDIKVDLK